MRKVSLINAFCCLVVALAITPALAQGTKQKGAVPKPAEQAPAATPSAADTSGDTRISVEGFRSAKFGMNEADVRSAIGKDFGLKPEAIKTQDNPAELTHSLLVTVPDLLPNGGGAEVSYVFGYKSKSLIQVGAA